MEKLEALEATRQPWQVTKHCQPCWTDWATLELGSWYPNQKSLGHPRMGWCPADHNRGCWPALDVPCNIQPGMKNGSLLRADIKLCVYCAGLNQPSKG